MSSLVEEAKVTSVKNFDEFIIELCSYDIRNIDSMEKIKNILNSSLLEFSFDKCIEVNFAFQTVMFDLNDMIDSFESHFRNYPGIDQALKNTFFKALTYIPKNVNDDGMVFFEGYNFSFIYTINHACYNFGDELAAAFDAFTNIPDKCLSNAFKNCYSQFYQLGRSAETFYEFLHDLYSDRIHSNYSNAEKIDFRDCYRELITYSITTVKDVEDTELYLKNNAKKIGLPYYIKLMHKLKMIGWHGLKGYYETLQDIAHLEEHWRIDYNQISVFKSCVAGIIFKSIFDETEKNKILTNLKLIGKYVNLDDYCKLMLAFYDIKDRNVHDRNVNLKFQKLLRDIVKSTINNVNVETLHCKSPKNK